jgi:hypothetical protein
MKISIDYYSMLIHIYLYMHIYVYICMYIYIGDVLPIQAWI